jgi:hypothetical protein
MYISPRTSPPEPSEIVYVATLSPSNILTTQPRHQKPHRPRANHDHEAALLCTVPSVDRVDLQVLHNGRHVQVLRRRPPVHRLPLLHQVLPGQRIERCGRRRAGTRRHRGQDPGGESHRHGCARRGLERPREGRHEAGPPRRVRGGVR